jgi:uncharacterized cupin superfamily protein
VQTFDFDLEDLGALDAAGHGACDGGRHAVQRGARAGLGAAGCVAHHAQALHKLAQRALLLGDRLAQMLGPVVQLQQLLPRLLKLRVHCLVCKAHLLLEAEQKLRHRSCA